MKLIIAPQAFKGTLSAAEAAEAICQGAKRVFPKAKYVLLPLSDGGDGTLDILLKAKNGVRKYASAGDAFGMPHKSPYGILPEGPTAVIELASVCGLAQIPHDKRNPALTTTYGLGQMIRHALDLGIRNFIICLGGSSSNDGGTGLAQALGARFLDKNDEPLPLGGFSLSSLHSIDVSGLDPRIAESHFLALCDVNIPLIGNSGATHVFARQKGADDALVGQLEKGMQNYVKVLEKDLGINVSAMPYSGAAGGTAAGLHAILRAELAPGIDYILNAVHFSRQLKSADLLISGEGRLDGQALFNKTVLGVAKQCQAQKVPVIALVGTLGPGYRELLAQGIEAVIPLSVFPVPPGREPSNAAELLADTAEQVMRIIHLPKKERPKLKSKSLKPKSKTRKKS